MEEYSYEEKVAKKQGEPLIREMLISPHDKAKYIECACNYCDATRGNKGSRTLLIYRNRTRLWTGVCMHCEAKVNYVPTEEERHWSAPDRADRTDGEDRTDNEYNDNNRGDGGNYGNNYGGNHGDEMPDFPMDDNDGGNGGNDNNGSYSNSYNNGYSSNSWNGNFNRRIPKQRTPRREQYAPKTHRMIGGKIVHGLQRIYKALRKERDRFPSIDISSFPEMTEPVRAFIGLRHITKQTYTELGLRTKFSTLKNGDRDHLLAFPYYDGDKVVNVQSKTIQGIKRFIFEKGGTMIPFNINSLKGQTVAIVTEGPLDAASIHQSGLTNVISVPNGTNSKLECFDCYDEIFDQIKTFIFAGDNDDAGEILLNHFIAKYGAARCKIVTWKYADPKTPGYVQSAKDANEMLMKAGETAVRWCVEHAEYVSIPGVETIHDVETLLDDYHQNGLPEGVKVAMKGVGHLIKFLPGYVHTYTGYPGNGKSTFVDNLTMCLLVEHGWKLAVFSPEKHPTARHYAEYIQMVSGKQFAPGKIPDELYQQAKEFLSGKIFTINDEQTDIDDLLDCAADLKRRHDIRQLVIDNFAQLDLPDSSSSDTNKISKILKKIVHFARKYDVQVHLVAHPRKPDAKDKGARPTLSDINGSMDFYNKTDVGVVVEYDRKAGLTYIYNDKTRFSSLGEVGKVALSLDTVTGRFRGCDEEYSPTTNEVIRYNSTPLNRECWLPGGTEQDLSFEPEEEAENNTPPS